MLLLRSCIFIILLALLREHLFAGSCRAHTVRKSKKNCAFEESQEILLKLEESQEKVRNFRHACKSIFDAKQTNVHIEQFFFAFSVPFLRN